MPLSQRTCGSRKSTEWQWVSVHSTCTLTLRRTMGFFLTVTRVMTLWCHLVTVWFTCLCSAWSQVSFRGNWEHLRMYQGYLSSGAAGSCLSDCLSTLLLLPPLQLHSSHIWFGFVTLFLSTLTTPTSTHFALNHHACHWHHWYHPPCFKYLVPNHLPEKCWLCTCLQTSDTFNFHVII